MSGPDTSDKNSQGESANEVASIEKPPRAIPVVIKEMPEPPSKSLWKDSARLLSVAAFIFSLATGAYATYSTWKTHTDAEVGDVGKLISQYYQYAEKLKSINQYTDTAYYNLLRTQQRSQAAQAVQKASSVAGYIDAGMWMSLAQINNAEGNCTVAQNAWLAALNNTTDIYEYAFSMRGIAYNDWCLNRLDDAVKRLDSALKAVSADKVDAEHTIINYMPPHARSLETINIHLTWLSIFPPSDCKILVPHYDAAMAAFAEATRDVSPSDKVAQQQIADVRGSIERYKDFRAKCG